MSGKARPVNVAAHTKNKTEQENLKVAKVATMLLPRIGPDATTKLIESAVDDMEGFLRSYESLTA